MPCDAMVYRPKPSITPENAILKSTAKVVQHPTLSYMLMQYTLTTTYVYLALSLYCPPVVQRQILLRHRPLLGPTLAPHPPLPTRASIHLFDAMTPPLPHRRPLFVQTQQPPHLLHFTVIPRRAHPMDPHALPLLEQKLSTDLFEIAAFQRFVACLETLHDGLYARDKQVGLDVVGALFAQV
jgi:hypothetical protein